ncbi:MAG: hypothetical protein RMX35_08945 [Nostoc sp. DcaGUA01]|nr:hypothetical protein [Nostoc sp. DcaGUA01]
MKKINVYQYFSADRNEGLKSICNGVISRFELHLCLKVNINLEWAKLCPLYKIKLNGGGGDGDGQLIGD